MDRSFTQSADDRKLKCEYNAIWDAFLQKVREEELDGLIRDRSYNRKVYLDLVQVCLRKQEHPRVLEVGCGSGIDLNLIARDNPQARLYGCDISSGSITVTLRINGLFRSGVLGLAADTRNLPLRDESFDVVYSQGLVEHFREPLDIVLEQTRVLKKSGFLIINVPQRYTGYARWKKKLIGKGQWTLGWETSFSYADLKRIGNTLGLREEKVCGYQYWKSWKEPAFVMRDLYGKFQRRNPFQQRGCFRFIEKMYDCLWKGLESRWGHYFLQNIVIVFSK